MSKNTKTYLLLGIVLLIWGVIGFRILGVISSEPESFLKPQRMTFKKVELAQQDTFSISANYRDPFLGVLRKTEKKKRSKVTTVRTFDIDVRYTGSVVNNGGKKRIYFITINGQQHLLEKGKKAMEVLLISGNEKQVTVKYKGMVKRIALQSQNPT